MRKYHPFHHSVQLDLFQPVSPRPVWRTLPLAVTQRVQRLLARLLKEHRFGRPALRDGKGASDD